MEFGTVWAGKPLTHLPSVVSTNTLARQEAMQGAPHGSLFWADEQTGGRGRLERGWQSSSGMGVYMSLLLRPDIAPVHIGRLSILAGVAVCEAMQALGAQAKIKWPNDIVADGRKLCGILCETVLSGSRVGACIIGVGVNVSQTAQDFAPAHRDTATSLRLLCGKVMAHEAVVAAFLRQMERHYEKGLSGELLPLYEQHSATLNRPVRVIEGDRSWEGRAVSLCDDGALVVENSQGEQRTVYAGDVSVRGLMGYV